MANEIGIHLLSFSLKHVLADESLFLLSECRKGDFSIAEGELQSAAALQWLETGEDREEGN